MKITLFLAIGAQVPGGWKKLGTRCPEIFGYPESGKIRVHPGRRPLSIPIPIAIECLRFFQKQTIFFQIEILIPECKSTTDQFPFFKLKKNVFFYSTRRTGKPVSRVTGIGKHFPILAITS